MASDNREREELARYLLQHSADDDAPQLTPEAQAWAEGEVVRIQRERIARLEAALKWYADKHNYTPLKDMRDNSLFTRVSKDDGERARKALGDKS